MNTLTIEITMRPWTVNQQRNMHYMTIAGLVKLWRTAAAAAAKDAKALQTPVHVHVRLSLKGKRSQDCGAEYCAVKAAIDGLVDAGVIPDDTPQHLASITMYAPTFGAERNRLTLTVHET